MMVIAADKMICGMINLEKDRNALCDFQDEWEAEHEMPYKVTGILIPNMEPCYFEFHCDLNVIRCGWAALRIIKDGWPKSLR
jgi:hypothetical protein